MNWSVGTKIGAGFAAALLALACIGVISYRSTNALIEAARLKVHTYEVLRSLQGLLSAMQDAETGQRGYIITGRDSYLEPYNTAIRVSAQSLDEVRKLTADNPSQQRRVDALQPQVAAKFDEMSLIIGLRRNEGVKAATEQVLTDKGKRAMDEIRKTVAAMENEETELLRQRDQRVNADAERTLSSILYGVPLAFVVVGVVGFLITRNISYPLGEMTGAATQIASGDLTLRVGFTDRTDEVGALARAFAAMTSNLQSMANLAKQIAEGKSQREGRAAIGARCIGQCLCHDGGEAARAHAATARRRCRSRLISDPDRVHRHGGCVRFRGDRGRGERDHHHRGRSEADRADG
jgi:CHASE3 domain sensor protein